MSSALSVPSLSSSDKTRVSLDFEEDDDACAGAAILAPLLVPAAPAESSALDFPFDAAVNCSFRFAALFAFAGLGDEGCRTRFSFVAVAVALIPFFLILTYQ